jgi:AhpD family alkylhydroperoxidase
MTLAELRASLPDYAKDLRLNLDSVLSEAGAPGLTQKQIAVIALASAIASRYAPLTEAIAAESAKHASAEELNGARAAAAIMGMNNIYYRFLHLVGEEEYGTLRAGLRMNVMAAPVARRSISNSPRSRSRRSTAVASASSRTRRPCASTACPRSRSRARYVSPR